MKQGTLSDPRMRETYQNFLGKQSSNVRNVPGQDFAMSKQGQAGLQGRLQSQYGKGYRSPGSQIQASVRNPSNEQAGIAQPAQPPAQQAPMQKIPLQQGPASTMVVPAAAGQPGGNISKPPIDPTQLQTYQLKNLQPKPIFNAAEQNQANWQKQQQNKNLVGSTMPVKDPYQLQQQNYDIMGVR